MRLFAALGLHAPGEVMLGAPVTTLEVAKCELDVVATMALYMHLLSERRGDDQALCTGIPGLAAMVAARLERSPHLGSALAGRLFQEYAEE